MPTGRKWEKKLFTMFLTKEKKLKIKNFKDYKKLNVKSKTLGEIGIWKFRFNHKLESQTRVHKIYIIRVHI